MSTIQTHIDALTSIASNEETLFIAKQAVNSYCLQSNLNPLEFAVKETICRYSKEATRTIIYTPTIGIKF